MSRLFGPLRQMGYVVRDIEGAMRYWIDVCGVGPWFYVDKLPVTTFTYRGARHDGIHLSIALANSGEVQVELIQQRCDTPSMGRDFLAAGREGLQHWSSWPEVATHAGRWPTATAWVRRATPRAAASFISTRKAIPAPSSRWRT